MNLHRTLRLLILALIVLGAGSLVADHITQDSLPASLLDYYYSEFFEQYPAVANGMGVVLVGATVISWIGLWFLWNPSRYIYAIALAASWITTPLLGPSISTAWGGTLQEAATMASGAILVLIFFTNLRQEFRGKRSEQVVAPNRSLAPTLNSTSSVRGSED